ncbi:IS66 Orf2 like protein [compost metagenome]
MIGNTRQLSVWACAEPTDMRKGFDGLFALVKASLKRDPLEGDLFLFVARNRRQARVLYWDGTGLCIFAKRLERGRFGAPWQGERDRPWKLTTSELALFLDGSTLVARKSTVTPDFALSSL